MRSAFIVHDRIQKRFVLPSRTQQSFKDETNINNIMAKYQKTGLLDHVNEHGASYGDQPTAESFHDAMNLVAGTNSLFEALPSSARDLFENDPSLFLEYVSDEDRRNALINEKKINQEDIEDIVDKADPPADPEPEKGD